MIDEDLQINKTLPIIKTARISVYSKHNSSLQVGSFSPARSTRGRASNSPSPTGSPISRLFDLTSSAQNKVKPGLSLNLKEKLKQWKTKRGSSFKLKCVSISREKQVSEGLANLKISLNLKKPNPLAPSTEIHQIEALQEEIIEEVKEKDDLNDSDLINLEGLRESLTEKKIISPHNERKSNVSKDSYDE